MGNFIKLLNQYLKTINSSYEVSTAIYPVNFDNWGYDTIAEYSDLLFVMCYNYYGSWSLTSGPSAPFEGTYYNISKSFANDLASIVAKYPQRVLYGVAYVGNHWKTKAGDAYSLLDTTKATKGFVKTLKYREIFPAYQSKEIMWDVLSKTSWLRWNDGGWNQIWYDNASSLAVKYDYTIQKGFGGIGIWALGYDYGRNELWDLIESKFAKPTGVEKEIELSAQVELLQNYPNPFNPETTIEYTIPVKTRRGEPLQKVTLKVYDLLGREVATLVDEYKQAGTYNITFNARHLERSREIPSGAYFYRLQTDSYSETKKFVLMK
jgi:GH18 family chitinase